MSPTFPPSCADINSPFLLQVQELVSAAQAGSSAAFAELSTMYAPRLFRTIQSITMNREDAEDALQDTFLRAFRGLRSFQGRATFYSWITRIAMNSALMILRRRRHLSESPLETTANPSEMPRPLDVEDRSPSPEQVCSQRQMEAVLSRRIGRLRPDLRTVLEMKVLEDCSLIDIAQTLRISPAAVKARLHRARKYCRARIAIEISERPLIYSK